MGGPDVDGGSWVSDTAIYLCRETDAIKNFTSQIQLCFCISWNDISKRSFIGLFVLPIQKKTYLFEMNSTWIFEIWLPPSPDAGHLLRSRSVNPPEDPPAALPERRVLPLLRGYGRRTTWGYRGLIIFKTNEYGRRKRGLTFQTCWAWRTPRRRTAREECSMRRCWRRPRGKRRRLPCWGGDCLHDSTTIWRLW